MKIFFVLLSFFLKNINSEEYLKPNECDCEPIEETTQSTSINLLKFQVTLYLYNKSYDLNTPSQLCTAIVLNRQYLLTVAECFDNYSFSDVVIYIGLDSLYGYFNQLRTIKMIQTYLVSEVNIHPKYLKNGPEYDQFLYNFALIKVNNPFNDNIFLKRIKPACIASEIFYVENFYKKYMSVSWGNENKYDINGIPILERDQKTFNCYQKVIDYSMNKLYYTNKRHHKYLYNYCFNDSLICANTKEYYTCTRDVGIGLFAINNKQVYTVGLYTRKPILSLKWTKINRIHYCLPVLTNFFVKLEHALNWLRPLMGDRFLCEISPILNQTLKTKNIPKLLKYKTFGDGCSCKDELINEFFNEYYIPKEIKNGVVLEKIQNKIIPPKGRFDFVVQIVKHNPKDSSDAFRFYCTGVIINAYHILTTASCANQSEIPYLYVYYGEKKLYEIENPYVDFYPYSKKVFDSFIHPYYNKFNNELNFDLQILKVKSSFKHTIKRLKPACFANEFEIVKQDEDKLILFSFDVQGKFETIVLNEKFQSNLKILLFKFETNITLNDLIESCETQICLYTNKKISLGNEGTPLIRLTKDFIEVVGLLKQDNYDDNKQHIHRFVTVPSKMKWIKNKIGQYNFCERDITNRVFHKKICLCDHKIESEKHFYPFVASVVVYNPTRIHIPLVSCKSLVINEYWVLTTYYCLSKVRSYLGIYVYLNYSMPFQDEQVYKLNLLGKLYHFDYFIQEKSKNLTLLKTIEKMDLGEDYQKYAGCLHKLGNKIKLNNKILLMDTENKKQEVEITDECYDCIKVKKEVCLNYEGNPIFQTEVRDSIAIGLLSVNEYIKKGCQQRGIYSIIYLQDHISWISNKLGEESYCKYQNYHFKPTMCKCQELNSVLIAQKIGKQLYKYACKGIIVNDYQVLTTASCLLQNNLTKATRKIAVITKEIYKDEFSFSSIDTDVIKSVVSVDIHPKNKPLDNSVYTIEKASYNLVFLRVKRAFGLHNKHNLYPACFGNRKDLENFNGYKSKIRSQFNLEVNWTKGHPEKSVGAKRIHCEKLNYICMNSGGTFCDTDQGAVIQKKTDLGYKVLGMFAITDEEIVIDSVIGECYVSYVYIGQFVDITDSWFLEKTGSDGFCEYEKYDLYKENNFCHCNRNFTIDNLDFKIVNKTNTVPELLSSSFCYILIGLSDEDLEDPFYLKFHSSCVLLNNNWALTYYGSWNELKDKKVYIGRGTNFKIINHDLVEYSDEFTLVKGIEHIKDSFEYMLLRISYYPRLERFWSACLPYTFWVGQDTDFVYTFGFAHENIINMQHEILVDNVWQRITTNYTYEQINKNLKLYIIFRDKNFYQKRDECSSSYICVLADFEMPKYNYGAPIYRFNYEYFELIGIFYPNTFIVDNKKYYKILGINRVLDAIVKKVGDHNLCYVKDESSMLKK